MPLVDVLAAMDQCKIEDSEERRIFIFILLREEIVVCTQKSTH